MRGTGWQILATVFVREVRAPHANLPDGLVIRLGQFKIHDPYPVQIEMLTRALRAAVPRIFGAVQLLPRYESGNQAGHAWDEDGFQLTPGSLHVERDGSVGFVTGLNFGPAADSISSMTHYSNVAQYRSDSTALLFLDVPETCLRFSSWCLGRCNPLRSKCLRAFCGLWIDNQFQYSRSSVGYD